MNANCRKCRLTQHVAYVPPDHLPARDAEPLFVQPVAETVVLLGPG
jgi:hypothetical protein